ETVVAIRPGALAAKPTPPPAARKSLRLTTVLCPLHLPRRRSLVGKLLHFFGDAPMQLGEIVPGPRRGPELDLPVDPAAVLERDDISGDLQVVDKPAVQPR